MNNCKVKQARHIVIQGCAKWLARIAIAFIGIVVFLVLTIVVMIASIKYAPNQVQHFANKVLIHSIGREERMYNDVSIKYDPKSFSINLLIPQVAIIGDNFQYRADFARIQIKLLSVIRLMPIFDISIDNQSLNISSFASKNDGYAWFKIYKIVLGLLTIHIKSENLKLMLFGNAHTVQRVNVDIGGSFSNNAIKMTISDKDESNITAVFNFDKHITVRIHKVGCDVIKDLLPEIVKKYDLSFSEVSGHIKYGFGGQSNFEFAVSNPRFEIADFIASPISLQNLNVNGALLGSKLSADFSSDSLQINGHVNGDLSKNTLEIQASASDIHVSNISKYWHAKLLPSVVDWLTHAVKKGVANKVDLFLRLPILSKADMRLVIHAQDVTLQYSSYFPPLLKINGVVTVDGTGAVDISVPSAFSSDSKITNANVNIYNGILNIRGDISGNMYNLAKILVPSGSLSQARHWIDGDGAVRLKLQIPLVQNLNHTKVSYSGTLVLQNVISKLLWKNARADVTFNKIADSDVISINGKGMDAILKLYAKQPNAGSPSIEEFKADIDLNIPNSTMIFRNIAIDGSDVKVRGTFALDFGNGEVSLANFSDVKFQQNNFTIDYKSHLLKIAGESFNLQSFFEFCEQFGRSDQNISVHVTTSKALFMNDIPSSDFKYINTNFGKRKIQVVSDIVSMRYRDPYKSKVDRSPIFVIIPNIQKLLAAVSENGVNIKDSGTSIKCVYEDETKNDSKLNCNMILADLIYYGEKTTFSPERTRIEFVKDGSSLIFAPFKLRDRDHQFDISGTLNLDTMDLKFIVYYTPAKIELINSIPIFKNALSIASLGSTKKGVITLKYDISGNIKKPVVRFNKTRILNYLLLPFVFLFS